MNAITIIFPHQLFEVNPAIASNRKIIMVEEWLFFNQYSFHKIKLVLHRASMKCYQQFLGKKKYEVEYIESTDRRSDIRELISYLADQKIKNIHYADTVDNWLEKRISKACNKHGISLKQYTTPNFSNTMKQANEFFDEQKKYFQTDFYKRQRQQRNILLEANGNPIGGKWSFDVENRKKLPGSQQVPVIDFPAENDFVKEARTYVEKHFGSNYGESALPFHKAFYPTSREEAKKWLKDFFQTRFFNFGPYEDAISKNDHYLFHSVLTPMLNIGLLDPQDIIDGALESSIEYDIPINSLEGFIRQIMGWREYIRIVYEREGSRQRTTNYWKFTRKIPSTFWKGDTGILPVDTVIKKVLRTGYSHHIERLMIMGNFFLLCEFDPDDVYKWFMEMYVDAYDWVMVPNVYGMTQFADGGLMVTKPYISSSNYILKMSDFGTSVEKDKKGEWIEIWNALFWRFMHVHRDFFSKNPRIGMLLKTFDKMPPVKRESYLKTANEFLISMDSQSK
ncbi:MAG: cryptochrome/photolyase family protein [Chitinophagaceae bacterium]|nr:cryptochrome/photolyase family protein [Chitinophagaceae bacterium]